MSKDWFYHIKTMKIEETEIVSANCTNKIKQDVNLVFKEKKNSVFFISATANEFGQSRCICSESKHHL